jgi:hypothetical protein
VILRIIDSPVYASLDHPLSGFAAKRAKKKTPLYACVERGDERSDVGVSRYAEKQLALFTI